MTDGPMTEPYCNLSLLKDQADQEENKRSGGGGGDKELCCCKHGRTCDIIQTGREPTTAGIRKELEKIRRNPPDPKNGKYVFMDALKKLQGKKEDTSNTSSVQEPDCGKTDTSNAQLLADLSRQLNNAQLNLGATQAAVAVEKAEKKENPYVQLQLLRAPTPQCSANYAPLTDDATRELKRGGREEKEKEKSPPPPPPPPSSQPEKKAEKMERPSRERVDGRKGADKDREQASVADNYYAGVLLSEKAEEMLGQEGRKHGIRLYHSMITPASDGNDFPEHIRLNLVYFDGKGFRHYRIKSRQTLSRNGRVRSQIKVDQGSQPYFAKLDHLVAHYVELIESHSHDATFDAFP